MISLIVAHDKNRVIGYKGDMPWHLPGDLKYFKDMTMGKPVIMGRKTFESIGKPLEGRRNIVITRNRNYHMQGTTTVYGFGQLLVESFHYPETMIIGGAQIYEQTLPLADRLYVTLINHEFQGDTYFPAYEDDWQLVSESEPNVAPEGYTYTYCVFERVNKNKSRCFSVEGKDEL